MLPVVAPQALTMILEAELAGANKGWTDLSADVNLGASPISLDYGIRGGGPTNRVAAVGTLSFVLKNSERSSGGVNGYYTPGHVNARSGWDLGVAIRLRIGYGGLWYYKFRGTLISIDPDAGLYRRRSVTCVAHDWLDEALNSYVRDTEVQLNKRSDQIVATLVQNSSRRQPTATDYKQGQSTFAYALDNVRDEKTSLMRALADVAYSEIGYLYMKGDNLQGGTLCFEDRHHRPKAVPLATFNDDMFELDVLRSRSDILNHVNTVVHPRQVDAAATTVLYQLTTTETVPEIPAGGTLPMTVFFKDATGRFVRVGATDVVTPVPGTDYIANTQADGGGSVITGDLSLSFSASSNTGTISLTNNGSQTAYLTTLQVRGKAIADRFELSVFKHNEASEEAYGEHDITYDVAYEGSPIYALGVCDWFLSLYGDPRMVISAIRLKSNKSAAMMLQSLAREPGDKITITESMTGISGVDYVINGCRLTIKKGSLIECSWVLAPADQQEAWLLEDAVAGLLEDTSVLGFV